MIAAAQRPFGHVPNALLLLLRADCGKERQRIIGADLDEPTRTAFLNNIDRELDRIRLELKARCPDGPDRFGVGS